MNGKINILFTPNLQLGNPRMYYPLGALYIASVLEAEGKEVNVIDLRDTLFDDAVIHEICKQHSNETFLFSCTTPEINDAIRIATIAREYGIYTGVGGAHASAEFMSCLEPFDFVVVGEGEDIINDIIDNDEIGIHIADRKKDFNDLPLPAWDILRDPFTDTVFAGERYGRTDKAATLITSRGCPFNCSFCANMLHAPVTHYPMNVVLREVDAIYDKGIRNIRFVDDNFTLRSDLEMLTMQLKARGIKYMCMTRADLFNKHIANVLSSTGCVQVTIGVESVDPDVLVKNNKKEKVEQFIDALSLIHQSGMESKVFLMSGLPGETEDSTDTVMDFMRRTKPNKWTLSTFTPYPGCDIYENPSKYGVTITNTDYSRYWNFCEGGFNHTINGQTPTEMWDRYKILYNWLLKEPWK
ncbi:MAG: B12-binding domain-containing radical SAM protein [Gammaproteobacteria bacterium]|nr:B12-binding domain-containing radical SAM protein [Gammaproteobacteria bacterium]